jgi:hypothetical protein
VSVRGGTLITLTAETSEFLDGACLHSNYIVSVIVVLPMPTGLAPSKRSGVFLLALLTGLHPIASANLGGVEEQRESVSQRSQLSRCKSVRIRRASRMSKPGGVEADPVCTMDIPAREVITTT